MVEIIETNTINTKKIDQDLDQAIKRSKIIDMKEEIKEIDIEEIEKKEVKDQKEENMKKKNIKIIQKKIQKE